MEGWGLVRNADKEEVMGSESKNGKVPLISKIAYGFGDVGCNFSWMFVSNFLMIFYTDVIGIIADTEREVLIFARSSISCVIAPQSVPYGIFTQV